MSWLDALRQRLADALGPDQRDMELDEEIRHHLELETTRLRAQGLSPASARARALERFGNPRAVAQQTRDLRTGNVIGESMQDVRWAVRSLRRSPGFMLVAGGVLATAIAATTAVYSVVNAVLLRPLPYAEPDRLLSIASVYQPPNASPSNTERVSLDELGRWREAQPPSIEALGGFAYSELPIRVATQAWSPVTVLVDPEFLEVLGVPLARGRMFDRREGKSAATTAIISHRLWRDAFHSDPNAVGRTFFADGAAFTVRGVLREDFQFPRADASYSRKPVDLILLAEAAPGFPTNFRQWLGFARLRPGASIDVARGDLIAAAKRAGVDQPDARDWIVAVRSLSDATRASSRTALLIVMAVAIVLLTIAAANVMTLQLSRGAAGLHGLAIRRAMGCSTGRLVRQLVIESALLAGASGLAGLALAAAVSNLIVRLSPVYLPVTGRIEIDGTVILFVSGVCAVTALVSGLLPAAYAARQSDQVVKSAGLRATAGGGLAGLQRSLCVVQIALGVALLFVAASLVGQMLKLRGTDAGFTTKRVAGFSFSVPSDRSIEQRRDFYQRALDEVRSIPGVESAGLISFLPPEIRAGVFMGVRVDGQPVTSTSQQPRSANHLVTSPGYFETVGMRIVSGRRLEETDREGTNRVVVVNEAFVKRFFPDGKAVGKHIGINFDGGELREIVGVVADIHDRGLDRNATATLYIPFRQFALPYGSMAVRTAGDPTVVFPEIRRRLQRVDNAVPLVDFQTLDMRLSQSMAEPRFYTYLATICAAMALAFVMLGVFGIVSFSVSRRTPEFGIRMAIGAPRSAIVGLVLRQSVVMAVVGTTIGLWLALLFGKVLGKLPFRVEVAKLTTLAWAVCIVCLVVIAAGYLPARRASRVSPLAALRHE